MHFHFVCGSGACPHQSVNSHPSLQPLSNNRICHDVGAKLLRCQAQPSLSCFGAAFSRLSQRPAFNTVIFDSIVHHGRAITRIDVKPVACQHWAPSTLTSASLFRHGRQFSERASSISSCCSLFGWFFRHLVQPAIPTPSDLRYCHLMCSGGVLMQSNSQLRQNLCKVGIAHGCGLSAEFANAISEATRWHDLRLLHLCASVHTDFPVCDFAESGVYLQCA